MKNRTLFISLIAVAVLLKILLFSFVEVYAPQSKFTVDSIKYLKTAQTLVSKGIFGTPSTDGKVGHEFRRTPGYPLFLGVLNVVMGIPINGVILIQVLMMILIAFITYKTAFLIEPQIAALSMLIVLYSPNLSVYSLMILTEPLFLFFLTAYIFYFVQYLKSDGLGALILSSLMLVLAAYVRPGAYYLGILSALFIFCSKGPKNIQKAVSHAIILLVMIYGLLGIWQVRNYVFFKNPTFSSMMHDDPFYHGIFGSYSRNTDPLTHGMAPLPYYINVTWRSFLALMTTPGSFKYFHCRPLSVIGKVVGYAWIVLSMSGFFYGIVKMGRNIYFHYFLVIILYFIIGSIMSEMWYVDNRFRVPITPLIAIISSYGWLKLAALVQLPKNGNAI